MVRQRIADGDSDEQVMNYVSRYGELTLLKPRFEAKHYLLWSAPLLLIALSSVSLLVFRPAGEKADQTGTALTEGEQARLDELLKK